MAETPTKKKMPLTTMLETETLAEFKAAAKIIGATSYSSLVHQFVVSKIREAKQMVSKEEFDRVRDEQMLNIKTRSKAKSESHKKWIASKTDGEEVVEDFEVKKSAKKKPGKKPAPDPNVIKTKKGEVLRFVEEDDFTDEDEK